MSSEGPSATPNGGPGPGAYARLLFVPVAEDPARSALSRADAVSSRAREMMGRDQPAGGREDQWRNRRTFR